MDKIEMKCTFCCGTFYVIEGRNNRKYICPYCGSRETKAEEE